MKYKQIVISLLIGLTLGLSTNAFAAVGDTVSAVFANFNYVVNGEAKTLDAPVLVYEGTSYVRTTQLSNLLGFDVTYKADSRTIEFNNPSATPAPSRVTTPSAVTDATYGPMPTPGPTTTPDPVTGITPTPDPNATPSPTLTPGGTPAPTTAPTPEPTPAPYTGPTAPGGDNGRLQACMSNSDIVSREMYQCSAFGF